MPPDRPIPGETWKDIPDFPGQQVSSLGRRRMIRWRPIPGYDGYEASDQGDIRSLDRIITTRAGVVKKHKGRVLNPTPPGLHTPYRMVTLNGKNLRVAPLILLTFDKPKPFPKAEARHLNDVKYDDRLVNLAWGTKSQNTLDSVRNLTYNRPWRYKTRKGGGDRRSKKP